jgi:ArsR family transcriptional regulator, arsenate/arsenite/antimonite-responsive transcriptional repressor
MTTTLNELTPATVVSGLAALAHETRLALFRALVRKGSTGESAGELARLLEVPPQTLSFHLKEMARAGLLTSRREGRHVYYAVDFEHVRQLGAYLTDSCCADEDGAGSR